MKRRLISVMMFALVAAAASSTVLYRIISAGSQHTVKAATNRVLTATRDLNAGALIAEADVSDMEWPVGAGSAWIRRREDLIGRTLLTPVSKDEPFAETRVAAKGAGAGLASRIPPGMRAIPVRVDELTSLSHFILPGMHVDVIATASGQSGPGMTTRTILQNLEVFATGQNNELDAKEKPVAAQVFNLLVTPQQAEVLSQAVAQARIQLVLRNPLDRASFSTGPIASVATGSDTNIPRRARAASVIPASDKAKALVGVSAPTPPTVEVIHGTKKSTNVVATATDLEAK